MAGCQACIGCSSRASCFFSEAGCFGAANATGMRRYAGVLREAVGLLGIGYCSRLLGVNLYAKTRTR